MSIHGRITPCDFASLLLHATPTQTNIAVGIGGEDHSALLRRHERDRHATQDRRFRRDFVDFSAIGPLFFDFVMLK
jgi:hypothetical protein